MEYLIISIAFLLCGALISLVVNENFKLKICSIFSFLSTLALAHPICQVLTSGSVLQGYINISPLFGNISFVIDSLSAVFLLLISIMSFIGTIYMNGYLKSYLNKGMNISAHCFFLMLLIASMLSVVTIQNGLFFLVAWEIMSLSSFFLVIFEGEKKEVLSAGIKYLVFMHLSVAFLIAMFSILTNATGSFDFNNYIQVLQTNSKLANLAFIFGFIGFGIKSGFVPFHNWLPEAHPAAPTHVSGIMSGVMLKTGIYGILRVLLMLGIPSKEIAYFVLIISVITFLYGILYAISQHDIKRLLAYSSIENIGIIGLGIAIGMLGLSYNNPIMATFGFTGGILHAINHAIFKELMFFGAGSVYNKTHTRDMEELGGLIKKMPYTGAFFIIGSIAICGLPPFNGFISEFLLYVGMLIGLPAPEINLFIILVLSIGSLALVGTMAILCFTKLTGIVFLGESRSEKASQVKEDVFCSMILPMGILASLTFIIGLFPQYIIPIIISPVSLFVKSFGNIEIFISIVKLSQNISWIFFIFLMILLFVLALRLIINRKYTEHNTWGCGYNKPNSHIQYTGSSYSNLFISTLRPLFKRISHVKKPKDLFPKDAYYELEIEDIEEAYIVKPLIKWDEKILAKFERIQNGNIQQYILFGLIFLVIAIIGVILIG